MDLIKIELINIGNEQTNAVSARELHSKLNIRKDFSDWIKKQIKSLGFIEGEDFISSPQKGSSGQTVIEYYISIDCAKHISMASRTKKGQDTRKYFLECEKQLKVNLKIEEQRKIDRNTARVQFPHLTDAVKDNLLTGSSSDKFKYSNECDLINLVVLGMKAKKYREVHNMPDNAAIRDYQTPMQIACLHQIQLYDSVLIEEGLSYDERKIRLQAKLVRLNDKLLGII